MYNFFENELIQHPILLLLKSHEDPQHIACAIIHWTTLLENNIHCSCKYA